MQQNQLTWTAKKTFFKFKLLKLNSILGHSLIIRLLLGIMADLPLSSLAMYIAIERIVFVISDLAFNQSHQNSYKLYKWGVIGLFLKVLSDFLLIPTFLLLYKNPQLMMMFVAVSGALMGAGQSFTQSSLDLFYFKNLRNYLTSLKRVNHFAHHSKQKRPFYAFIAYNLLMITASLGSAYFLYHFYEPVIILAIPIILNLIWLRKIVLDAGNFQAFYDTQTEPQASEVSNAKSNQFTIAQLHLSLMNAVSMLCLLPSCYFLFLSLFHSEAIKAQYNQWAILLFFALGYEFIGSLIVELVAPTVRKHHKLSLSLLAATLLGTSLFFTRINIVEFDVLPMAMSYILFLLYPLSMSVCLKLIGHICLGEIQSEKTEYIQKFRSLATSTIPGHLAIACYCIWLVISSNGLPSITQALDTSLYLSMLLFFLTAIYLFMVRPQKNNEIIASR